MAGGMEGSRERDGCSGTGINRGSSGSSFGTRSNSSGSSFGTSSSSSGSSFGNRSDSSGSSSGDDEDDEDDDDGDDDPDEGVEDVGLVVVVVVVAGDRQASWLCSAGAERGCQTARRPLGEGRGLQEDGCWPLGGSAE